MPKLIIPTRNRSTSLLGVLNYLERFYPETNLVIADGSNDFHRSQNAANVKTFKKIGIDYRAYAEELSFFDRLIAVIKDQPDEFLMLGADDDFPMMEVFDQGEAYLREHPECATAMGGIVNLFLKPENYIQVRLNPARNVLSPSVEQRVNIYSQWPVSTSYAVTRREILIERYERANTIFLAGFYDFVVGVHDVSRGTMKAIPTIGYIGTRNYNHAYFRPEEDLIFLRRSETALKFIDVFQQDLMHYGNMEEGPARKVAELVMRRRISEQVGNMSHRRKGFAQSRLFQNKAVQQQMRIFQKMFIEGTPVRKKYQQKLAFISESLRKSVTSQDNAGEPEKSETMVGRSKQVST